MATSTPTAPAPAPSPTGLEPSGNTPSAASHRTLRTVVVLALLAAAGAGVAWKVHANTSQQQSPADKRSSGRDRATPVTIVSAEQRAMPIYLTALGTVTPSNSVTVKTRVDGELLSVVVREGQSVSRGQLLAQIDPRPYEAALIQAQGQLTKDEAAARYTTAEAARYTALLQAGVVSAASEQAQAAAAGQGNGAIAVDRGAVQAAKLNLTYTRIISPIDGVVGLRQVDPGNVVHASDTTGLFLVTQVQPVSVIFTLPEDQLPQVREALRHGKRLIVQAYDRGEVKLLDTGALLTLDNQIDLSTGTDKAKATFLNKDTALFPNQFVNIRLILEQRADALVVPAPALQNGAKGTFVFVVKPGEPPARPGREAPPAEAAQRDDAPANSRFYVEARPVIIDLAEGTDVILRSGLSSGEQIVVDGQERLKDGSRVSPKAPRKEGDPDKPHSGKGHHA